MLPPRTEQVKQNAALAHVPLPLYALAIYCGAMAAFQGTAYYWLANVCGIIAAGLIVCAVLLHPNRVVGLRPAFAAWVFAYLCFLLPAWAAHGEPLEMIVSPIRLYLMMFCIVLASSSIERGRLLLTALAVGGTVAATGFLLFGNPESSGPGAQALMEEGRENHNAYGVAFLLGLQCAWLAWHVSGSRTRWGLALCATICLAAILGNGSRQAAAVLGGVVTVYLAIEFLPYLLRHLRVAVAVCLVFASAVGAILATPMAELTLLERLTNTDIGSDARVFLIQDAWHTFTENPWLGVGKSGFERRTGYAYAHSAYMDLLSMNGLGAFFSWIGLQITILLYLVRARKRCLANYSLRSFFSLATSVQCGVLAHAWFFPVHHAKTTITLSAVLVGMAMAVTRAPSSVVLRASFSTDMCDHTY